MSENLSQISQISRLCLHSGKVRVGLMMSCFAIYFLQSTQNRKTTASLCFMLAKPSTAVVPHSYMYLKCLVVQRITGPFVNFSLSF